MIKRWVLMGLVVASVTGCARIAESNFNPLNWFGNDRAAESLTPDVIEVTDDRPLINEIASVRIERTPGGAILHAVGIASEQGAWLADLVIFPERTGGGTLAYQFRILPPNQTTRVSTQASRQVSAALFLSDQRLETVRAVEVYGATNARTVRR